MTISNGNDRITVEKLEKYKKGDWDVYALKSCSSTFDIAKEKIKQGAKTGTLIVSDIQTGGRGRQARKWLSPEGGLWMSIILKPELDMSLLSSVTLLCAVAVLEAMEEMLPSVSPKIKWPNDIYIDSKKVCGMLTEAVFQNGRAEYVIIGIGINANNTTEHFDDVVRQISTSFKELGIYVNRARLASLINDKLQDKIAQYESDKNLDFVLDYYHEHMQWLGDKAVMKNTINGEISSRGTIKGIDNQGRLLMETDGEINKIISGELSLRRA